MNDYITVGAASLMGALVFATGLVRWAVTPPVRRGRHRGRGDLVVPLAELMPDWPPVAGVRKQGIAYCEPCGEVTAGVITRDGFRCDCGTPAGGVW